MSIREWLPCLETKKNQGCTSSWEAGAHRRCASRAETHPLGNFRVVHWDSAVSRASMQRPIDAFIIGARSPIFDGHRTGDSVALYLPTLPLWPTERKCHDPLMDPGHTNFIILSVVGSTAED